MESPEPRDHDGNPLAGMIIGAVVGAVCWLLIAFLVYVSW